MIPLQYDTPKFKLFILDLIKDEPYSGTTNLYLKKISRNYEYFKASLPPRAEPYLNNAVADYVEMFKKPKFGEYQKIHEQDGVQVFLDTENVSQNFDPGSYNHRMITFGITQMLNYIKDILPNKKPRIIITNLKKNKHSKSVLSISPNAVGLELNKNMYLDWRHIDNPKVYIHEYAHYVADLVNSQTEELLIKAYKDMIDMYFRLTKRKRVDPDQITDKMRTQISKKLGFPVYGLTNHHELFAVLIENWKEFPNNKLTYKFKSLSKDVLSRVQ